MDPIILPINEIESQYDDYLKFIPRGSKSVTISIETLNEMETLINESIKAARYYKDAYNEAVNLAEKAMTELKMLKELLK